MPEGFPERLRKIRKSRKLTQQQLAKKSGIGQCILSRYEKGHNSPKVDVIEWLCGALDVSATELLGF